MTSIFREVPSNFYYLIFYCEENFEGDPLPPPSKTAKIYAETNEAELPEILNEFLRKLVASASCEYTVRLHAHGCEDICSVIAEPHFHLLFYIKFEKKFRVANVFFDLFTIKRFHPSFSCCLWCLTQVICKIFPCPNWSFSSPNKRRLFTHIRKTHRREPALSTFICGHCNSSSLARRIYYGSFAVFISIPKICAAMDVPNFMAMNQVSKIIFRTNTLPFLQK